MSRRLCIFLVALTCTTGCEQFHLFMDEDTAIDTAEEEQVSNPTVDISWEDTGIAIEIENGFGYEFTFGLVESTPECAADVEYGCWTAESCISDYITPQETFAHPRYCHSIDQNGTTLAYSESLAAVITASTSEGVIPGSKTAFPMPTESKTYEFDVTYYLQAVSTGENPTIECWAWGVNPDYYIEEGCKSPVPVALDQDTPMHTRRFRLPIHGPEQW